MGDTHTILDMHCINSDKQTQLLNLCSVPGVAYEYIDNGHYAASGISRVGINTIKRGPRRNSFVYVVHKLDNG